MSQYTNQLQQLAGRRAQVQTQLAAADEKLKTVLSQWKIDETARIIGVHVTEKTRKRVKSIFDGIGTSALQAVFGPDSKFEIKFDQTESQRRRAWFCVDTAGVQGDPTQKSGNSMEAVLSTMLRRAVIILHPQLTNFLACDEPLSGIDVDKQPGMALLDREMVDAHGMQILVVTHDSAQAFADQADAVIEVERTGPRTSGVNIWQRKE
jgi:ABC-type dipeptide/oligopeptide/nickel transport system ATPase component